MAGPGTKKVEIGGLWTAPSDDSEDHLHGGRFLIDVSRRNVPLAVAAPGMP
jgi:hypothetical protein